MTALHQLQPNRFFDDLAEAEHWLAANVPGARILKSWTVTKLAVLVEAPLRSVEPLPPKCPVANLFMFPSAAEAERWHGKLSHTVILAKWRCRACKHWHYWSAGAESNTNGEAKAGSQVIPQRIQKLIQETKMPEVA